MMSKVASAIERGALAATHGRQTPYRSGRSRASHSTGFATFAQSDGAGSVRAAQAWQRAPRYWLRSVLYRSTSFLSFGDSFLPALAASTLAWVPLRSSASSSARIEPQVCPGASDVAPGSPPKLSPSAHPASAAIATAAAADKTILDTVRVTDAPLVRCLRRRSLRNTMHRRFQLCSAAV